MQAGRPQTKIGPGGSLRERKKMFLNGSFAKILRVAHMFNHGWWQLAVGGWRLAVGGGWRRLVVGDWWLVAVGSGWQFAVRRRWRLAVGSWWRLVVGGWWSLGAVLNKKKSSS